MSHSWDFGRTSREDVLLNPHEWCAADLIWAQHGLIRRPPSYPYSDDERYDDEESHDGDEPPAEPEDEPGPDEEPGPQPLHDCMEHDLQLDDDGPHTLIDHDEHVDDGTHGSGNLSAQLQLDPLMDLLMDWGEYARPHRSPAAAPQPSHMQNDAMTTDGDDNITATNDAGDDVNHNGSPQQNHDMVVKDYWELASTTLNACL